MTTVTAHDIARRLQTADGMRLTAGARSNRKEWTHFLVFARCDDGTRIDILVNFSFLDGVQTVGNAGGSVARATLLVRVNGRWRGSVRACDERAVDVRTGRIDLRLGEQVLAFRDGAYWLDVGDAALGVAALLRLTPRASPHMTPSASMDSGHVRWLITPRLAADGAVWVDGRRHELRDAPAYHDHNWGTFSWGGDFSWQWGVVLDASSDAFVVISRVLNGSGNRLLSESVLLGVHRQVREFRADDVAFEARGQLRAPVALRVPGVMNLVVPHRGTDIPREVHVHADSRDDALAVVLDIEPYAQIGIPNDHRTPGVALLTEAPCTGRASGIVAGEHFQLAGPGIWETTHVVRA